MNGSAAGAASRVVAEVLVHVGKNERFAGRTHPLYYASKEATHQAVAAY
jgi:hypothetical protein